jgi:chitin synthase
MVYHPAASRPVTNYLDMAISTTSSLEDLPTDVDLDRAVQDILHSADLNSVTKREIRRNWRTDSTWI